jgi:hypothetical protein
MGTMTILDHSSRDHNLRRDKSFWRFLTERRERTLPYRLQFDSTAYAGQGCENIAYRERVDGGF